MHYHHLYFPEVKTKTQKRCDLPTVIYQVVVLVFHLGPPDNHHIATPLISSGGQDLFYSQVTHHLPICYLSNISFSIRLRGVCAHLVLPLSLVTSGMSGTKYEISVMLPDPRTAPQYLQKGNWALYR